MAGVPGAVPAGAAEGQQLSPGEIREIDDAAFDQVVNDILICAGAASPRHPGSNAEIQQAALWSPHPDLMQNELFMTDGRFDISKYQAFLNSPAANEELLLQLEQYYRDDDPPEQADAAGIRGCLGVGRRALADVARPQRDRDGRLRALNISQLVPGDVEVTDREVRSFYDANREQFRRTATARVNLAFIPKAPTAADTAAAMQRARSIRAEIEGGADFAEVAQRESADPGSAQQGGDLGTFGRGTRWCRPSSRRPSRFRRPGFGAGADAVRLPPDPGAGADSTTRCAPGTS
jgi:peptidyl-prolyl cis-trans isomerase D